MFVRLATIAPLARIFRLLLIFRVRLRARLLSTVLQAVAHRLHVLLVIIARPFPLLPSHAHPVLTQMYPVSLLASLVHLGTFAG